MPKAGFSESQLQQAINTSIVISQANHGIFSPFIYVPSLWDEFDVGWDSAFFLQGFPPMRDSNGCNIFIQYKLSMELTRTTAAEWNEWGKSYFRFRIPHGASSDPSEERLDYHQWDALKELSNKGFAVYYATNFTISRTDLIESYSKQTLLGQTPAINIANIGTRHRHATFTLKDPNFKLHSELEEAKKMCLGDVLSSNKDQFENIESANHKILNWIRGYNCLEENWIRDLELINRKPNNLPSKLHQIYQHRRLSAFFHKHFGVSLLWIN